MFGPIGLCCISLDQKNVQLTEPQIQGLFKDIAAVTKILIFQREPALKCFIEFADTGSMERALRHADRISQEYGKVSLYHSKKDSLKNAYEFRNAAGSGTPPTSESPPVDKLLLGNSPGGANRMHSDPWNTSPPPQAKSLESEPAQMPPLTPADLDDNERKFLAKGSPSGESAGGCVVLVEGFTLQPRLVKLLQNLLGCYGNLIRMVANFPARRFLAEMENAHQANLACIYLKEYRFFGCLLAAQIVSASGLTAPQVMPAGFDFLQPEERTHRFKKHLSIKFNPPSKILHMTSLAPRVDQLVLFELASQVHEPVRVYKLIKNAGRSDMYLLEFESLGDSIEVLAALHNKIIENKSLKISFSHPEIN